MKGPVIYLIGFIGTDNFYRVRANSVKEAKTIFAKYHNIQVSSYIVAKKWTAEMMNKYIGDGRKTIDSYYAEKGYPYCEKEGVPA